MVGTIGPLPHIPTIFSQIPPSSPITNPGHTGPACGMKGKWSPTHNTHPGPDPKVPMGQGGNCG